MTKIADCYWNGPVEAKGVNEELKKAAWSRKKHRGLRLALFGLGVILLCLFSLYQNANAAPVYGGPNWYIRDDGSGAGGGPEAANALATWQALSDSLADHDGEGFQYVYVNMDDRWNAVRFICPIDSVIFSVYGLGADPILNGGSDVSGLTWIFNADDSSYAADTGFFTKIMTLNDSLFMQVMPDSTAAWMAYATSDSTDPTGGNVVCIYDGSFMVFGMDDSGDDDEAYDVGDSTRVKTKNGYDVDSFTNFYACPEDSAVFTINAKTDISINGLNIVGGHYGVYITGACKDITIDNSSVTASEICVYVYNDPLDITVQNSTLAPNFIGAREFPPGIYQVGTYASEVAYWYYQLSKFRSGGNGSGTSVHRGMRIQENSSNVTVDNCTIKCSSIGIDVVGSSGNESTNARITNSDVTQCSSLGISRREYTDSMYVYNNFLHDNGINFRLQNATTEANSTLDFLYNKLYMSSKPPAAGYTGTNTNIFFHYLKPDTLATNQYFTNWTGGDPVDINGGFEAVTDSMPDDWIQAVQDPGSSVHIDTDQERTGTYCVELHIDVDGNFAKINRIANVVLEAETEYEIAYWSKSSNTDDYIREQIQCAEAGDYFELYCDNDGTTWNADADFRSHTFTEAYEEATFTFTTPDQAGNYTLYFTATEPQASMYDVYLDDVSITPTAGASAPDDWTVGDDITVADNSGELRLTGGGPTNDGEVTNGLIQTGEGVVAEGTYRIKIDAVKISGNGLLRIGFGMESVDSLTTGDGSYTLDDLIANGDSLVISAADGAVWDIDNISVFKTNLTSCGLNFAHNTIAGGEYGFVISASSGAVDYGGFRSWHFLNNIWSNGEPYSVADDAGMDMENYANLFGEWDYNWQGGVNEDWATIPWKGANNIVAEGDSIEFVDEIDFKLPSHTSGDIGYVAIDAGTSMYDYSPRPRGIEDNYWLGTAPDMGWIENNYLTLKAPNGGEEWTAATSENITFTSIGVDNVMIEYSNNNGSSWIEVIASRAAEDSTYSWTIPNDGTVQALVRITVVEDATETDESDGVFTISVDVADPKSVGIVALTVVSLLGTGYAAYRRYRGTYRP